MATASAFAARLTLAEVDFIFTAVLVIISLSFVNALVANQPWMVRPSARHRDSVRAQYSRVLGRMPSGYLVSVGARITDGAFVTDLELFTNPDGTPAGRSTWVYHVTGGKIQRALVLRQPRAPKP